MGESGPSETIDCELYLTAYDQAKFSIAGRDYSGRPNINEAVLRQLLEASLDPRKYGTLLFEALLPNGGELLAGYREGLVLARHEEKRLRFRLHLATTAPQELHDLHWELLYDPWREIALSCSRDTAFSRYLSVPSAPPEVLKTKPRLLVVLSTPQGLADFRLPELDWEEQKREIDKALTPLEDLLTYEHLEPPTTVGRIRNRLLEGDFHALHLHAHGLLHPQESTAELVLERDDRQVSLVGENLFSKIFEGERNLRLVTLVACHSGARAAANPFSGLGPALVRRGVPAVVAMRRAISVSAASLFTEHFYRNLARCGRVDLAANEARLQLHLSAPEDLEWGTPALFTHLPRSAVWTRSTSVSTPSPTGVESQVAGRSLENPGPRTLLSAAAITIFLLVGLLVLGSTNWLPDSWSKIVPEPKKAPFHALAVEGPTKVAVAGFQALDFGEPSDSNWVTIAASELFHFELSKIDQIHTISPQKWRHLTSGLTLPEPHGARLGLSVEMLDQVQQLSGADLLVWGSFRKRGHEIRLTLDLQDTKDGRLITRQLAAPSSEFLSLFPRSSATLVQTLGLQGHSRLSRSQQAHPSNPQAAQLYRQGLEKLRVLDTPTARGLLERAIEVEPHCPLLHAALAEALWDLGYEKEATVQAEAALKDSRGLEVEERAYFLAVRLASQRRWKSAAAIAKALWNSPKTSSALASGQEDHLAQGLRLALWQARAQWGKEAQATLQELVPLAQEGDPRLPLFSATAAKFMSRSELQRTAARTAAAGAKKQGSPLLLARAHLLEAEALAKLVKRSAAKDAAQAALTIYHQRGHSQGEANAYQLIGNLYWSQQDFSQAGKSYQNAGNLYESISNHRMAAKVLGNKALILQEHGDDQAAIELHKKTLQLFRQAEDSSGEIYTLIPLGEIFEKKGEIEQAGEAFQNALQIGEKIGIENRAYPLRILGAFQGRHGSLSEAKSNLEKSLQLYRKAGNKQSQAPASYELGRVFYRQGNLETAEATFKTTRVLYGENGNREGAASADRGLGDVWLSRGNFAEAQRSYGRALEAQNQFIDRTEAARTLASIASLRIAEGKLAQAIQEARAAIIDLEISRSALEEARTRSILAHALLAQGQIPKAQREIRQAQSLLGKQKSPLYYLPVELVAAQVELAVGEKTRARQRLQGLLAVATSEGFLEWELKIRLVLGEITSSLGSRSASVARFKNVLDEAKMNGFGLIAGRAEIALSGLE